MHFGLSLVADEQALEVVEPGEGAFDDPAIAAEAGAVVSLAAGDHRLDAALPDQPPIRVVVVAAVGDHAVGSAARPAAKTGDRRDSVEGKRETAGVDEEMVLGAGTASVHRARARFGAPFFAWIWLESATARDQSISRTPAAATATSEVDVIRAGAALAAYVPRRI